MNSFEKNKVVGEKGVDIVVEFLRKRSLNSQVVTTDKGTHAIELQLRLGDILFNSIRGGNLVSVEVKTEWSNKWGNLYFELWSNKSRGKRGWFYTMECDWLFYLFLNDMHLIAIPWAELHSWAGNGRIEKFPNKKQNKHHQLNDTWGFCVPLSVLRREIRMVEYQMVDSVWVPSTQSLAVA